MDDKSYFLKKSDSLSVIAGYYANEEGSPVSAPDDVGFSSSSNFPKKMLSWIAISEQGTVEPFLNGKAIN